MIELGLSLDAVFAVREFARFRTRQRGRLEDLYQRSSTVASSSSETNGAPNYSCGTARMPATVLDQISSKGEFFPASMYPSVLVLSCASDMAVVGS